MEVVLQVARLGTTNAIFMRCVILFGGGFIISLFVLP